MVGDPGLAEWKAITDSIVAVRVPGRMGYHRPRTGICDGYKPLIRG